MVEVQDEELIARAKIHVKGIVQGVGFRPFIYSLAKLHSLNGWVLNSTDGVVIEVEGKKSSLDIFIQQISQKAPSLAVIDSVDVEYLAPINYDNFVIRESEGDKTKYIKISPDVCTCIDCLVELFNPLDRRYRYPFINCTNCGPRFTIIKDIPYDRRNTTMQNFKMCQSCQAEYDDPSNRRFHAQPNACPICGPSVFLEDINGIIECQDPIQKTIELLSDGHIIAVKGLGGFHLACDAENDTALNLLRERKRRTYKPFAIMSANIERIKEYCFVNDEESLLLESFQRPIVLLKKRKNITISEFVAPNNDYIGVMLPYTPLHHLLLNSHMLALVMTSGNISEEPIAYKNEEAKERLVELADYFLMHNRDIHVRCDDSVARVFNGHQILIRRSRGYAPYPIDLDFSMKQILACGPEMKNTFCLTKDNHAFISHHIGDLQNVSAYNYYIESIEHYKKLFRVIPEIVAHDLHPDYLSTRYALEQKDVQLIGVQHHHAHIASCMAEYGLKDRVIGVACDGTGYGSDGAIWGFEFLYADYKNFHRYAQLRYTPLPGGDSAAKEPYRMAISYLYSAFGDDFIDMDIPLLKRLNRNNVKILKRMVERGINSPLTSSCGRLFDAVSSIIGVCDIVSYDAQAAIELEMIASTGIQESYDYEIIDSKDRNPILIDVREMIRNIVYDLNMGISQGIISAKFHNTIVDFIVKVCEKMRYDFSINNVVLGGGSFQNNYILTKLCKNLDEKEFNLYFHKKIPTNDGGISLGQAVIANFLQENEL